MNAMMEQAHTLLRQYYGYTAFRKGQSDIVASILQGRDTVGVLPTGGGKSICYQIPALALNGTTLVVSPLISLMKDQVDTLESLDIPATYINSSLDASEARNRIRKAAQGEYKLLYIAPERLESERFVSLLGQLHIPLIAIDEAHCISHWGHDFRPSYMAIVDLIAQLPQRPIISAFTATATTEVVEDIVRILSLRGANVYVTGFSRDNLAFSIAKGENKRDYITQYVRDHQDEAGIIYAATRKDVEQLYEFVRRQGVAVGKYHAGMTDEERADMQERFLYDELRVMVATNAFGMGIDKPNVRFVIHYNMPKNIEAYYQEAGRAGRDGDPGECVLLFSPQDIHIQKFLLEQGNLTEDRKALEYKKMKAMIDYCHTPRCLQQYVVRYFGEDNSDECGRCSSCTDTSETVDMTDEALKIFSCVKRMRERFGTTLVAKVLRGAKDKRVRELGFDSLSTYGILSGLPEKDIVDRINALTAEGYLQVTDGQYPVLQLAERATRVLLGDERVLQKVRAQKQAVRSDVDDSLFGLLRELRKDIAAKERIPAFMVFADATLREMAQAKPRDERGLRAVKGLGEAKVRKYGEAFLAVIRGYLAENGGEPADAGLAENDGRSGPASRMTADAGSGWTDEPAGTSRGNRAGASSRSSGAFDAAAFHGADDLFVSAPEAQGGGGGFSAPASEDNGTAEDMPSHVVTYNMFTAQRMTVRDIAKERGMSIVTIQNHVIRCAEEGFAVDWDEVIPAGYESLIVETIQEIGLDKLKPIKEALPKEIDYFAIHAVICKHSLRG